MTKHQAACAVRQPSDGPTHEVYRLRVSGADRPAYWLDAELTTKATLDDLDSFLRGIWLECCGHLSSFTIGPQDDGDFGFFRAPKRIKQPPLTKLDLQPGEQFGYTYDFGSSTDLTVQVQAHESVAGKATDKVRLLARNLPPVLACSRCDGEAIWVHSWEYNEETGGPLLYCGRHGKATRDEQLPVVNSPRMGVCGYEGGNDDRWPPAALKPTAEHQPTEAKPRKATKAEPRSEAAAPPTLRLSQDTGPAAISSFLELLTPDLMRFNPFEALLADVQALPLKPEAVWLLGTQEMPDILPPQEGIPQVVLLVDAASGQIVASEVMEDPTAEDLQEVVLMTMLDPAAEGVEPQRPGQMFALDAALAFSLHTMLAPLGIRVERQDSPELEGLLAHLGEVVGAEMQVLAEGQRPRAFLQGVPDEDVSALWTVFGRFMQARPWQYVAPDKPLRASWTNPDGTSGQLYATLLGDLGEVYGLALYPDWLSYNKHILNSFNPELVLLATGGLESLTMSQREEIHPEDWERLRAAGLPARAKAGPALIRMGLTGTQPPTAALRPLTAVLKILSERAERKASTVTSLKAEFGGVSVQYPADPRAELTGQERAGSVQLRLSSGGAYAYDGDVVMTGPPEMLVRTAFAQARRLLDQKETKTLRFYLPYRLESPDQAIEDGGFLGDLPVRLWEHGPGTPTLTLAHLARLGLLMDGRIATLEASTQGAEVAGLTVELEPKAKGE